MESDQDLDIVDYQRSLRQSARIENNLTPQHAQNAVDMFFNHIKKVISYKARKVQTIEHDYETLKDEETNLNPKNKIVMLTQPQTPQKSRTLEVTESASKDRFLPYHQTLAQSRKVMLNNDYHFRNRTPIKGTEVTVNNFFKRPVEYHRRLVDDKIGFYGVIRTKKQKLKEKGVTMKTAMSNRVITYPACLAEPSKKPKAPKQKKYKHNKSPSIEDVIHSHKNKKMLEPLKSQNSQLELPRLLQKTDRSKHPSLINSQRILIRRQQLNVQWPKNSRRQYKNNACHRSQPRMIQKQGYVEPADLSHVPKQFMSSFFQT